MGHRGPWLWASNPANGQDLGALLPSLGAGRSAPMKRLKIGTTTTVRSASDARRVAFQFLGDIARGKDPMHPPHSSLGNLTRNEFATKLTLETQIRPNINPRALLVPDGSKQSRQRQPLG